MTVRAAIYARYSSDLQKATSIEDQIAMAERYCAEQGWVVVHVFTDHEKTGRHTRRPGFQELKAAVDRREVDMIVVEAVDRLTRRITDALHHYDLFKFNDTGLHSITEGRQDFYKILLTSFGAQNFSEMIGEHTRRGMQGALKRQRLHTRAYGYRKVDTEKGLNRAVDPETSPIVLRIFEEFASGKSTQQIALGLNADRITAPNGGSWDSSTLRGNGSRQEGILRNRLYIGQASTCKRSRSFHPTTGVRKSIPTAKDAVEVEIPELRIVPDALWEAVQAEIGKRQAQRTTAGNPRAAHRTRFPLSGLLVCGKCGAPYIVASKTSYRCRENRKGACANGVAISRKRIEARVFGRLRGQFLTAELAQRFDAALAKERRKLLGGDLGADLARLRQGLAKAEAGRANIFRAIEDGAPFEAFRTRAAELERKIADLARRVAATEQMQRAQAELPPDARAIYAEALSRMEQLLGDPEVVDQAHEHLATLIRRIVLTPDPEAPHGLAAEILTDLGSLLSAAGETKMLAERFAGRVELTAGMGALPPRVPRSPGILGAEERRGLH